MWVKFHNDMDYSPRPGVTIAYKAGWSGNVPTPAGEAAVAAGRAVRLKAPRKGEEAMDVATALQDCGESYSNIE